MSKYRSMKMVLLLTVIGIMLMIFYLSSQSYQEQSLTPLLGSCFTNQELHNILPDIAFQYGDKWISIQKDPIQAVEFLIRKCAHLFQYALLAFTLMCLFFVWLPNPKKSKMRWSIQVLLSVSVTILTASLDEYNQSLTPNRTGSVWDIILDIVGGGFGILFFHLIHFIGLGRRLHTSGTNRKQEEHA